MSSLAPPERVWWKPLGRSERLWLGLALLWAVVLFLTMIVVSAAGEQDTPMEFYRVTEARFQELTDDFVQQYRVGTDSASGIPIVAPPPGDVYLLARRFQWYPILELKKGETYRIHLSSTDLQHGFSLPQDVFSLNFQVLPGYLYVVTLTPQEAGEFPVVCNEFCGAGHHTMVGKIVVKE